MTAALSFPRVVSVTSQTSSSPAAPSSDFASRLNAPTSAVPEVQQQANELADLIRIQVALQQENQYFTMMSNILKLRHETMKAIISNLK